MEGQLPGQKSDRSEGGTERMGVRGDSTETQSQYILSHRAPSALSESDQGEIKDDRYV